MRLKEPYITKYGADAGSKLYSALQKEAAHARWKAYYKAKSK
jgi:hypothetical protein